MLTVNSGPNTREALGKFQQKFGLPVTKIPSHETVATLSELVSNDWTRDQKSTDFSISRIKNSLSEEARLRALNAESDVLYKGNKLNSLIDAIIAAPSPAGGTKYLDLDGFTDAQATSLIKSFATYPEITPESPIRLIPRSERDFVYRTRRGHCIDTANTQVVC
jgi:hypothetical protein